MKTDISAIPVFVVAAESESFSDAAQKLHLTRSAVAKTISKLEERLGIVLFIRTTRSTRLTDSGNLYYKHCLVALNEIITAEELLEGERKNVSGTLKVSIPVLFGNMFVTPVLTQLSLAHPELQLVISYNDHVIPFCEEDIDLAIRIGKIPETAPYVARKIADHRMMLCASPDYLAGSSKIQTIADLNDHSTIAYSRNGQIINWRLMSTDNEVVAITPNSKILMDDMQSIVQATVAGAGVTWLPSWLIKEKIACGQLLQVLPDTSDVAWDINIIWTHNPRIPLKLRVAIDTLSQQIPPML